LAVSGIQLERHCERSRFRTIAVVIAAALSALSARAGLAADGPDRATQPKSLTYDLFVGQPIVKPAGFVSASTTAGFNLNWSF